MLLRSCVAHPIFCSLFLNNDRFYRYPYRSFVMKVRILEFFMTMMTHFLFFNRDSLAGIFRRERAAGHEAAPSHIVSAAGASG